MLPLCRDEGVGVVPWSPLARGRLSRPVGEGSARSAQNGYTQHSVSSIGRYRASYCLEHASRIPS